MSLNGSSHQQTADHFRARYCVIGSGMGGSALARTLAETGEDVLLVEAGDTEARPQEKAPVVHESVGRSFGLPLTRSIELGGTSNAWHGICTPLEEIDFETRSWIQNSGWPINLNDLLPFYPLASKWLLEADEAPYDTNSTGPHAGRLRDINFNHDFVKNKLFLSRKPAFRWKHTLRKLIRSGKLRCLTGTAALELQMNEDGLRVDRLLAGTSAGKVIIDAEVFIVCAGALETPRLLLNSKTNNGKAVGNQHDLVGRYLLDHPTGQFSKLRFHSPAHAPLYAGMPFKKQVRIMAGLKIKPEEQRRRHLPNHGFWMRPSLMSQRVDDDLLRSFLGIRRKRDLSLKQIQAIIGCKDLWYRILVVRFGLPATYRYSDMCFFTEQLPNPDSRVRLSETHRDRWGYPIASINWQLMEDDLRLFQNYVSLLFGSGMRSGQYELAREDTVEVWNRTLTSSAHHAGTARMASSPEHGVVDANLKVFGISNLYVCDASVFPTNGSANPSLTITALGVRLGKYLLGKQSVPDIQTSRAAAPANLSAVM